MATTTHARAIMKSAIKFKSKDLNLASSQITPNSNTFSEAESDKVKYILS